MDKVKVREATHCDHEAILAIRKLHGGRDYLSDCYHDILKYQKGYVAVVNNEIVAFRFAGLIDNGLTHFERTGRVRKDYEGSGVYRMLGEYTRRLNADSAQFSAYSFSDRNKYLGQRANAGLLNVKCHRDNQVFISKLDDLRKNNVHGEVKGTVKRLEKNDLEEIFDSESLLPTLFPDDMLVTFWVPFRIMKENIDHILAVKGIAFGSNISKETEASRAMLSIGHPYRCDLGYCYVLDMYGTNAENVYGHMVSHFSNAVTTCTEECLLFEVYPEPEIRHEVEHVMLSFGFKVHKWDAESTMYYVVNNHRPKL